MAKKDAIYLRWEKGLLVPAANVDRWSLQKLPELQILAAEPWHNTARANRYLHAMIGKAVENSLGWSVDKIKLTVKARHGWVDGESIVVANDKVIVPEKSTASMNRDEIAVFIEQTREFILTEVCPGMDPKDLDREIGFEVQESGGRGR